MAGRKEWELPGVLSYGGRDNMLCLGFFIKLIVEIGSVNLLYYCGEHQRLETLLFVSHYNTVLHIQYYAG